MAAVCCAARFVHIGLELVLFRIDLRQQLILRPDLRLNFDRGCRVRDGDVPTGILWCVRCGSMRTKVVHQIKHGYVDTTPTICMAQYPSHELHYL